MTLASRGVSRIGCSSGAKPGSESATEASPRAKLERVGRNTRVFAVPPSEENGVAS